MVSLGQQSAAMETKADMLLHPVGISAIRKRLAKLEVTDQITVKVNYICRVLDGQTSI